MSSLSRLSRSAPCRSSVVRIRQHPLLTPSAADASLMSAAATNNTVATVNKISRRNCTVIARSRLSSWYNVQVLENGKPMMRALQQQPSPPPPQARLRSSQLMQQQVRYKRHTAKMSQHLETLDDMAHEKSRQEAQEKRQKKKEKKAARKSGDKKHKEDDSIAAKGSSSSSAADKDFDDDHHPHSDDDEDDDNSEGQEQYGDTGNDDNVMLLPDPEQVKERMMKIVNRFSDSLKTMRGAEPTVEIFDDVVVNAYGSSNTSLKSVALVVLESPTLAVATCYDPALAKNVCNAIQEKLELNPSIVQDGGGSDGSGGATIRIPLPRVSMETRQKTALALKKRAEAHRQKIRKHRRTALDIVKQGVAGKLDGISKDDAFRVQKEIETMTDQVIHKLNEITDQKHESIMAV